MLEVLLIGSEFPKKRRLDQPGQYTWWFGCLVSCPHLFQWKSLTRKKLAVWVGPVSFVIILENKNKEGNGYRIVSCHSKKGKSDTTREPFVDAWMKAYLSPRTGGERYYGS